MNHTKMRSYLAMFDTKKDKSWTLLYNSFVINKNTDIHINGMFLKDLWFNYQVKEEDMGDIHFMLLFSKEKRSAISDDINRMGNDFPSVDDNPTNTCKLCKNFVLKYDLIEKTSTLLKKHGDKEYINLYDLSNNMLSMEIILCKEKYYLTLPNFNIWKQL